MIMVNDVTIIIKSNWKEEGNRGRTFLLYVLHAS